MGEDYKDLFNNLPFKDKIHRVSYRTDVSNYLDDQDDTSLLDIEEKGMFVDEKPVINEQRKGMELKNDLEMIAESVDRGYDELNKATKIKVFKQLLNEYKDPVLARTKFIEIIKKSSSVISSDLKNRVTNILAKRYKEFPEDFDLEEFVSFASAWEKDPSLQNRSFVVKEAKHFDKTTIKYIKDLKTAGFKIPKGMERIGETENNFVKYLTEKYSSILSIIKRAAIEEGENLMGLLNSIHKDSFRKSMDKIMSMDNIKESVGFRRMF